MCVSGAAMLPALAFDGATKRNKPSLAVGALVFARVAVADRDMEPELTCAVSTAGPSSQFAKKDWVTGQGVYGELKGGTVVQVSMVYARRCVHSHCGAASERVRRRWRDAFP
jgi:exosome complex component RRP40